MNSNYLFHAKFYYFYFYFYSTILKFNIVSNKILLIILLHHTFFINSLLLFIIKTFLSSNSNWKIKIYNSVLHIINSDNLKMEFPTNISKYLKVNEDGFVICTGKTLTKQIQLNFTNEGTKMINDIIN